MTAAAAHSSAHSAREALTSDTHKEQRQKAKLPISFVFLVFSHETSPIEKRMFRHTKPRNIFRGPSVLDRFKQQLQML